MSAVTAEAVFVERQPRLLDPMLYHAALKQAPWGDGEVLVVRVEPKAEAIRHADYKHLYGNVYTPVEFYTGTPSEELHLDAKARFMPDDGRTSVTQLSRPEFLRFSQSAEGRLRDVMWEAFERWDPAVYRQHRDARRRRRA